MNAADSQNIAPALAAEGAAVLIRVKVVPNASRTKIAGLLGDRLKVAVAAPPEQGKANDAVCQLIARTLGVPSREVTVVAGHTQPAKTVRVEGLPMEQVVSRLGQLHR